MLKDIDLQVVISASRKNIGGNMKNNKEELVKLIQENPELPLVFMISNDEVAGDYGSTVYEEFTAYKSEVYRYERFGDLVFSDDRDEIVEYYSEELAEKEEYKNLIEEKYTEAIEKYVDENIEFYEAIVIYAS